MPQYVPKFREKRLERGMTQQQAGASLGIDRTTIQKWEVGVNSPTMDDIYRLANLYSTKPASFFETVDREIDGEFIVADRRFVFQCKGTSTLSPERRDQILLRLKECEEAFLNVPLDFVDHWVAALKSVAALACKARASERTPRSRRSTQREVAEER